MLLLFESPSSLVPINNNCKSHKETKFESRPKRFFVPRSLTIMATQLVRFWNKEVTCRSHDQFSLRCQAPETGALCLKSSFREITLFAVRWVIENMRNRFFFNFWKKQLFRWRACDWNTIVAAGNQLGTVRSKSLSLSKGESDSFRVRYLSSDRVVAMLEAGDNVKFRWTEVSELTFVRNITWLTTSKFLFIMSGRNLLFFFRFQLKHWSEIFSKHYISFSEFCWSNTIKIKDY